MTRAAGGSIAPVLALMEKFGAFTLFARTLDKLVSADARAALHAAGIVSAAPPVPTWKCEVRGCGREVRANYDGARKPLVAVCSQSPPACAPVELTFEDVAQQQLSVSALVSAACGVLGAEVVRAVGTLDAGVPLGESRRPILVATMTDAARDVFWCGSPRDTDLAAFCARRERAPRGTLVLVPTGEHVPIDVAARFAAGEAVEVLALSDALDVRGRRIVRVGARAAESAGDGDGNGDADGEDAESVGSEPIPFPGRGGAGKGTKAKRAKPASKRVAVFGEGLGAALGVTRWEQVRVTVVDEATVRLEANGHKILRTYVELGMADGRKTDPVTPVVGWGLFVLMCKKGSFRPSEYKAMGKPYGVKVAVGSVRAALKGAFGLEGDPFRVYSRREGWGLRFSRGEGR